MTNDVTTFAGFLKTKYATNLVNTIPEMYVLQRDAPFGRSRRIGEQYQQAVITRLEHGGTYSRTGQGPFALNAAAAGAIEKAIVNSSQFVLKSAIDYETLAKAVSKGELSYGTSGDQLLKNMALSTRKRLEVDLWHGQSPDGLGVVNAVAGAVYTISDASWAPGNWVAMEGAIIEAFDAALTTQRAGTPTLDVVDIANRQITVSAAHTGIVATDRVFYQSQRTPANWNSFLGLIGIASSTGTLFNISTTANSVWGPTDSNIAGPLTFSVLQEQIVNSVVKGLMRGATCYVSTLQWSALLTEQAALRRYGGDFDGRIEFVNGANAIRFWTSSGPLMIKPSIYCPDGRAFIVPGEADQGNAGALVRVGATDVTFQIPGMDEPLVHVGSTTAGVELFSYYNQAMFTAEPGQITMLSGLTNP